MIKLGLNNLFQLINLLVRILVVYLFVMGGSHVIVVIKEVIFILIPLLV